MFMLASITAWVMRLISERSSDSTLYGHVSVCGSVFACEYTVTMWTASRFATSPEACPRVPSATMARRSVVGSEIESSLCSRLRPMLVAPEKRTRLSSRGKDELTGAELITRPVVSRNQVRYALREMASLAGAQWWSYAEGNETVLGLVVAALAIGALVFVGSRNYNEQQRRRRRR